MKLYALVHKEYRVLDRNLYGWLGTTMEDGVRVFTTKKAAKKHLHDNLRIVTFTTTDKGTDARLKETWSKA